MKALNAWIRRYRDASAEIDRLSRQLDQVGFAFAQVLPLLSDEQLAELDALLDIHHIVDGEVMPEPRRDCTCVRAEIVGACTTPRAGD